MAVDSQLEYDDAPPMDEQVHQMPADSSDLPVKDGAVFGIGAFLLSYFSLYAVVQGAMSMGGVTADDVPATWETAAWVLLTALGAGFEVDGETAAVGGSIMELSVVGGFVVLYVAVPIVVLVAAGYSMAKYTNASDASEAVRSSALVVPGWLALSVVFAFLSEWESEAEIAYAVVTSDAILYAGVLVPALFAIAGGLLYSWPDPAEKVLAKIDS
ncbi:hypothetical protein ACFQS4_15205 [Saliphagus sp. GCM10025317]